LIGGALLVYLAFGFTFALVAFLFLLLLIPISKLEKIPTANISMQVYSKEFLNLRTILFSVALFFFTLHWGAEHTSYGLYLSNSLHLNTFLMGAYISIPIFFLGLFAYFGGQWIDRKHISHRKIFIIGIFVSGLGQIMMVNPDVFISFGWRVFHEIGDGLFFVSQLVWVSLLFGQKSIGGNYGMVYTIMVLGAFAGALVFAPLGEAQGYGAPLVISGAILVIESFLIAGYFALRRAWN
jgi:MFS family permease